MSTTRHLRRCAALSALACALAVAALAVPTTARPPDQEHYSSSYADPATSSSTLAHDKQYASYGEPHPDAATAGDLRLVVVLCISGALVLMAAGLAGPRWMTGRQHAVPASGRLFAPAGYADEALPIISGTRPWPGGPAGNVGGSHTRPERDSPTPDSVTSTGRSRAPPERDFYPVHILPTGADTHLIPATAPEECAT